MTRRRLPFAFFLAPLRLCERLLPNSQRRSQASRNLPNASAIRDQELRGSFLLKKGHAARQTAPWSAMTTPAPLHALAHRLPTPDPRPLTPSPFPNPMSKTHPQPEGFVPSQRAEFARRIALFRGKGGFGFWNFELGPPRTSKIASDAGSLAEARRRGDGDKKQDSLLVAFSSAPSRLCERPSQFPPPTPARQTA